MYWFYHLICHNLHAQPHTQIYSRIQFVVKIRCNFLSFKNSLLKRFIYFWVKNWCGGGIFIHFVEDLVDKDFFIEVSL